jgi:hypothetical protein
MEHGCVRFKAHVAPARFNSVNRPFSEEGIANDEAVLTARGLAIEAKRKRHCGCRMG